MPTARQYWVTARGGQTRIFDPHGPVDVTDYLPSGGKHAEAGVQLLHAPGDTDMVFGTTKNRHLLVWKHTLSKPMRTFTGVHAQVRRGGLLQPADYASGAL